MPEMRVSGELVTFNVRVSLIEPDGGNGDAPAANRPDPWRVEHSLMEVLAGSKHSELQERVEQAVVSDLGDVFVDDVIVKLGSIELLIIVTTAFKVIKNFNEYVEVLGKAAENVRRACRAFMRELEPHAQMRVTANYSLGSGMRAALNRAEESEATRAAEPITVGSAPTSAVAGSPQMMLVYLMALNIALLLGLIATLIWYRT